MQANASTTGLNGGGNASADGGGNASADGAQAPFTTQAASAAATSTKGSDGGEGKQGPSVAVVAVVVLCVLSISLAIVGVCVCVHRRGTMVRTGQLNGVTHVANPLYNQPSGLDVVYAVPYDEPGDAGQAHADGQRATHVHTRTAHVANPLYNQPSGLDEVANTAARNAARVHTSTNHIANPLYNQPSGLDDVANTAARNATRVHTSTNHIANPLYNQPSGLGVLHVESTGADTNADSTCARTFCAILLLRPSDHRALRALGDLFNLT